MLNNRNENVFMSSLIAEGGGIAGLVVDISLFPLDTIKTRLQSSSGFYSSGGFHGIYRGLGPQIIGSVPQAALFFCTYETIKETYDRGRSCNHPIVHMVAASCGEVVACLVRVPVEVVKQRRQTGGIAATSSIQIAVDACRTEGFRKGLYRGFGSTVMREVPFAFIQFPIYERLKLLYSQKFLSNEALASYQVALCGALAGGIAAAVTTPLDVIKTRIMLADHRQGVKNLQITSTLRGIVRQHGLKGLFAGFVPRMLWITIGGAIFFGSYDTSKKLAQHMLINTPICFNR